MIAFDEDSLDAWLGDYEEFNHAFRGFCFANFKVFGVKADFVPNVTRRIHERWVADHDRWIQDETSAATTKLSHVKIAALLLFALTSEPFIGNMYDHEYQEEEKYKFRGTEAQFEAARQDLIDGREVLLAFDFAIIVINWFEQNRVDRAIPFRQPLTADMRHDILSYLLNGSPDPKALYLILKAMYLRPAEGGAHN
ncbi:hypothetical protein [Phreatobacter sp.]|uniref:hypothetical protein n=1 Tax=Phreatobacter sp. TaxID=1966341 RepID=UPI003F722CF9